MLIFWNEKSLNLLFFVDTKFVGDCFSSDFNVHIHLNERELKHKTFFILLKLSTQLESNPIHELTDNFGWISLPIKKTSPEENLAIVDFKRFLLHEDTLSLPICTCKLKIKLKPPSTDGIPTKIYVGLQAVEFSDYESDHFKNIDKSTLTEWESFFDSGICRLVITCDHNYASSLKNLIFLKSYDSKFYSNSFLELTEVLQGKNVHSENISLSLLHKGFNHSQYFILNNNDQDSEISLFINHNSNSDEDEGSKRENSQSKITQVTDKKRHKMDQLYLFKIFSERNNTFATTLFIGRGTELKTSNARLVLPDLKNEQCEPIIISISRMVEFTQDNDNITIKNGLNCTPDGPLKFDADLFIKPITKTKKIRFKSYKKEMIVKDISDELKFVINHFCPSIIEEELKRGDPIVVVVSIELEYSLTHLRVFLEYENHKPVL